MSISAVYLVRTKQCAVDVVVAGQPLYMYLAPCGYAVMPPFLLLLLFHFLCP